ncbi:MAG: tRNA pseudouridine(55) synthase TruB [Defluviitaleaceae bacterium]|nr:tRNA pseudouridine(55) synthase TruB [Defluviitaleaceae bacterium]
MGNLTGFLNVYKEAGYTSHDVVAVVRKILREAGQTSGRKFKVGHTGTLDPAAEGVLPICLGKATRLADYAGAGQKRYTAVLKLGQTSDTLDDTGQILSRTEVTAGRDEISAVVASFVGEIEQVPPMYSAVKVGGRRLYDIARSGQTVERAARRVIVSRISIEEFHDDVTLTMDVTCSRGTYIRTLCHDIGRRLGCGAVMGSLVRTAAGMFGIDTAIRLGELRRAAEEGSLPGLILPADTCLPFESVTVNEAATPLMLCGGRIPLTALQAGGASPEIGQLVFAKTFDGQTAGLFECVYDGPEQMQHEGAAVLKPLIVLADADRG